MEEGGTEKGGPLVAWERAYARGSQMTGVRGGNWFPDIDGPWPQGGVALLRPFPSARVRWTQNWGPGGEIDVR